MFFISKILSTYIYYHNLVYGKIVDEDKEFNMFDVFVKKYITVKNIIFFIIALLFLIFITKIKDIAILFFAS